MAADLQFGAPHAEALALIRGKPAVTREVFDGLLPELRARAFTVSGISQFDVLQSVRDEIASLAAGGADGKTWDEAKAAITEQLGALEEGAERRAELLLRTHGFQAFQAANYGAAQADQDTTHMQYLATEDDRVRDTHLALNGLILPKDDPFWATHMPPWEWGCRCRIRSINPDLLDAARERDASAAPDDKFVLEGPAAKQLREGTLLRNGRRYDVRPPVDKVPRDEQRAVWQWHPENLTLPLDKILERYDEPTANAFRQWAARTEISPGQTVASWAERAPTTAPRPSSDPGPDADPGAAAAPVEPPSPPPPATPSGSVPIPKGPPASAALQKPKGMAKKTKEGALRGLAAVDRVHGDGVLPEIPLKGSTSQRFFGAFSWSSKGPVDIVISKESPHPAMTMVHELGHFLDLSGIGTPGRMESMAADGALKDVLAAIKGSQGFKSLAQVEDPVYREYLLRPKELWARAYAQYIAEVSADETLTAELAEMLKGPTMGQWKAEDFAPIRAAISRAFEGFGWQEKKA